MSSHRLRGGRAGGRRCAVGSARRAPSFARTSLSFDQSARGRAPSRARASCPARAATRPAARWPSRRPDGGPSAFTYVPLCSAHDVAGSTTCAASVSAPSCAAIATSVLEHAERASRPRVVAGVTPPSAMTWRMRPERDVVEEARPQRLRVGHELLHAGGVRVLVRVDEDVVLVAGRRRLRDVDARRAEELARARAAPSCPRASAARRGRRRSTPSATSPRSFFAFFERLRRCAAFLRPMRASTTRPSCAARYVSMPSSHIQYLLTASLSRGR